MAQHIVALDLAERVAHVAIIAATFRRAELVAIKRVDISPDDDLPTTLHAIKQAVGVPIDSLVCSFASQRASVRTLTFPFGDVRRLPAAVQFELEGQVPYALENVVLSWQVIERSAKQIKLLAAVTPKEPLREQLSRLTQNRLDPRAIMHPAVALAELLPQPEVGDKAAHAALGLGSHEAHLCVVRQGLRAIRTIRFAGTPQQTPSSAEGDNAQHAGDQWSALVAGVLTTLKGLEPEDRPKTLYVTGPAAAHADLVEQLRARLGVDVAPLDLVAASGRLNIHQRIEKPEQAVVLGMAMALVRHGKDVPLNFRQGDLAYRGDIQLYRGQLVRVAAGLAIIFALTLGDAAVRWTLLGAEEERLGKRFCQTTQKITGKEICDPTAALATMRQPAGAGVVIPGYSATALAEMLSSRLDASLDVQFDELDVRVDASPTQPDRITARGEAQSFETTEQLSTWLKRDVCVQDVEVSKQRKGSGGRVEFNLAVKVQCPVGTAPGQTLRPGATPPAPLSQPSEAT